MMLKWGLKRICFDDVDNIHLAQAAQGLVVGLCECSNEVAVSIKSGTFLRQFAEFWLCKKDCTTKLITYWFDILIKLTMIILT